MNTMSSQQTPGSLTLGGMPGMGEMPGRLPPGFLLMGGMPGMGQMPGQQPSGSPRMGGMPGQPSSSPMGLLPGMGGSASSSSPPGRLHVPGLMGQEMSQGQPQAQSSPQQPPAPPKLHLDLPQHLPWSDAEKTVMEGLSVAERQMIVSLKEEINDLRKEIREIDLGGSFAGTVGA